MDHYKLFIDGKFIDAASGKTFVSIDPGNETPIATVSQAGKEDAEAAIAAARKAFNSGVWSELTPVVRMARINRFADEVIKVGMRLAVTESMDSGMIIPLASPLANYLLLRNLGLMAATKFPWEEEIIIPGSVFGVPPREFIRREPVGVCVGIIPWNFPMNMAFWKIAQAITMGNTIVLKPASNTPLSAFIIAEAAKAAGIPDGVINVIAGPGGELGRVLCTHPDVDKIAFTGSTEVGREIMRMASDTVKKVTLELGGKSANIILDDADIDLAVEGACAGTFTHQGQICESGTRILVSSKIYDHFMEKMKKRTESLRVGYQLDPATHIGPLVSKQQLASVESYVQIGKEEGAHLFTGGKRVEVPGIKGGYYYAPTIFTDVDNKMRIAQEEIFGPVACIIKFDEDEEAIAIANDSIYGLAGGVFSTNQVRAERVARGIRTGTMWINNYHVFADYCPFGGYKQSGVGRELGMAGLQEYTQIKRIHVNSLPDAKSNMLFGLMSDYRKVDGFAYNSPTTIIAGHGALSSINKTVVNLGCRRALILTDQGVHKTGLAQKVKNALAEFCVGIYDKIPSDPDLESVDDATAVARELKADCIVSVGGGSVCDAAKGVRVTLKNGGTINDYFNFNMLSEPQIPLIAIPTTSGTGSEVTNVAILTNHKIGRKFFLIDSKIVPNVAILDPMFTMFLPKDLTISTAMDAMTHAIEGMTAIVSNRISDGMALQAIRLIIENLPLVIADGQNEKARLNLQLAATMAGWAFGNSNTGLVHGMAHTLGALHHVPHGIACGIILPNVMRFNVETSSKELAQIAHALNVNITELSETQAALKAADAVEAFMMKVGHPMRLRDVGVPRESLEECAIHALADPTNATNGRPVNDVSDILKIFQQTY